MENKKTKDEVQQEAVNALMGDYKGLVFAATGVGKSKIGLDWIKKYKELTNCQDCNILIVVPTEKLRDDNWKDEFTKWGMEETYEHEVTTLCYASLHNVSDGIFDVVLLDEVHNITELSAEFFKKNKYNSLVGLTATYPRDPEKRKILEKVGLNVIYEVTLDNAVKWGLVAPYSIDVILVPLDSTSKVIKAGSKDKPFMTTEQKAYDYSAKQLADFEKARENIPYWQWSEADKKRVGMLRIGRMRKMSESFTKGNVASFIINNVIPKESRTIIFCGSVNQANSLCANTFHSKTKDTDFYRFINGEINKLSCVGKLNEGINVPNIDNALITQVNSNELDLIQRIGRIIRFREGHVGKIYIIVAVNTVDYEWFEKASANLNGENINFIEFKDLKEKYG